MREKLQSLPLVELREIAKSQGIKYIMKFKKAELIEEILKTAANDRKKKKEKVIRGRGIICSGNLRDNGRWLWFYKIRQFPSW